MALIKFHGLVAGVEKKIHCCPLQNMGIIINAMMPTVTGSGEEKGLSALTAGTVTGEGSGLNT